MNKHILILVLLFPGFCMGQKSKYFFDKADTFFKTYRENGKVKYAEIKQNPNSLKNILMK